MPSDRKLRPSDRLLPIRSSSEDPSEPERKVVQTYSLLRETVKHLSRHCPSEVLGASACEALMDLRPRLEEALEAFEDIEQHRSLTEEELALRRAFCGLLLVAPRKRR